MIAPPPRRVRDCVCAWVWVGVDVWCRHPMGLPNQHCKDPAVPLYIDKSFCQINTHGWSNARANSLVRVPPLQSDRSSCDTVQLSCGAIRMFLFSICFTWINFTVFFYTHKRAHTHFVSTSARQPCNGLKRNTKQMVFQLAALLMLTEHVIQAESERKRKSLSQIHAGVEGHGQHGKMHMRATKGKPFQIQNFTSTKLHVHTLRPYFL